MKHYFIKHYYNIIKQSYITILFLVFLLLIAPCAISQVSTKSTILKEDIKIMTYNIRNCRGLDNKTDFQRIAEIIKGVNPDIVALQELDSATTRSNGIVVLNELAVRTKMHGIYGPSISYQGGKYGIAILSKLKPISKKSVPLPGREEARSILIAEFQDYIFCCTHLSLNEDDRLKSAVIINGLFDNALKPVFLAGDLNAHPESDIIKTFSISWQILNNSAEKTIPADNPKRCIDYILTLRKKSANYSVIQSRVENEPLASDHLPVWVKVSKDM